MNRRRRLFVNDPERMVDRALLRVAEKRCARIFPKVRVADAFLIDHSGLPASHYRYALSAHFDFVVGDARTGFPFFAVEFDGPSHIAEAAKRNDAMKDYICLHLGLPLLRVDSGYLRPPDALTQGSVLEWLADLWFEYDLYARGKHRGLGHFDGKFNYRYREAVGGSLAARVGLRAYFEGRDIYWMHEQIANDLKKKYQLDLALYDADSDEDKDEEEEAPLLIRPHDLTYASRFALVDAEENDVTAYPAPLEIYTEREENGFKYAIAYSVIQLRPQGGGYVIGKGRCRSFDFPPVTPGELSCDLAVKDAYVKFLHCLAGTVPPANQEQFEALKQETQGWTVRRSTLPPGWATSQSHG